jgi:peptidoglycan hydrolase-like protein with peptidoglycan-binding domain
MTSTALMLAVLLVFAFGAPSNGQEKTLKDKAVEVKDAIKDKTVEVKDKVKAKIATKVHTERSLDIRLAQTELKAKGYDPGPIDGIHGAKTSRAVRVYQKAEQLTVNGRLDEATLTRLLGPNTAPAPNTMTK